MAKKTYYYKGRVYESKDSDSILKSGYVEAKNQKEALIKVREAVGAWHFDTVQVWNGDSGRVLTESICDLPILRVEGAFVWVG